MLKTAGKWVYTFIVLATLLTSLALPGSGQSAPLVKSPVSAVDSMPDPGGGGSQPILQPYSPQESKIEAGLLKELQDKGAADFVVVMAEQADLSAAYTMSDWNARGDYVYNTLNDTAVRTQKPVIAYLQERSMQFQSFFAGNEVYVYGGSIETANALAAIPDVGLVRASVMAYITDPVYLKPVGPEQLPGGTLATSTPAQESSGGGTLTDQPAQAAPAIGPSFGPSLEGTNATVDWGITDTKAIDFWNKFGYRGDGIIVANIDTGVQWNHPALVNQFNCPGQPNNSACWSDPTTQCGGTGACDNHGHGTHTMGSMVSKDNPALSYIAGMAPNAKWIACKGCNGAGGCPDASLLSCADWILAPGGSAANRPHIVNNSWAGGSGDNWYLSKVNAWRAAGIFPAFAAGNPGPACGNIMSPGDYQQSFASGGHDEARAGYVNSGKGPSLFGHDPYTKPNLSGPAVSVISTIPTNTWGTMTGTSMASPHTAGAVALLWSCAPALVGQIDATFQILQNNTDVAPAGGCSAPPDGQGNYTFGYGYLNALKIGNAQCTRLLQGSLTGTVTSGGSPLNGATVTAKLTTSPYTVTTAVTNGSGVYSMNLDPGTYNTQATLHGYNVDVHNGLVINGAAATTQNYILTAVPPVTVTGTVTDGGGRGGPLFAKIVIESTGFSTTLYTDALTGSYSVALYQQTSYTFTVSATLPGYRERKVAMSFSSAAVTRNFALEVDPVSCSAPGYRSSYVYYQEFEADNGGFAVSGTLPSWAWGTPTSGPWSAHSGVRLWATNLSGNYNNSESSYITSPNINLSSLAGKYIYLQWWQWVNVEAGYDYIYVDVSKDGGATWANNVYTYNDIDENWKRQQVLMDPSYAVSNFRFRFHLTTDSTVTRPGWYIDDIGIGGGIPMNESFEGAAFPPTNWSIYDLDWGGTLWASSTSYAHTGSKSAKHGYYTPAYQDGWLVSPDIFVKTGAGGLTFWEYTNYTSVYHGHYGWWCDEARPGGCGSPPFNYQFWTEFASPVASWRSQGIGIGNGLAGHTIRLAWEYTGLDADDWYIDDFSLSDPYDLSPLACLPVTDAHLTYSPPSMSATVDLGAAVVNQTLTLSNVGQSAATFTINEFNGSFTPSQALNIPAFTSPPPPSGVPASTGPRPESLTSEPGQNDRSNPSSELAGMLDGITAFAIDVTAANLVSFNTDTPGTFSTVGSVSPRSLFAGDFLGGNYSKLYALDYANNHLYTVNTSTVAVTDIGPSAPPSGYVWTGLAGGMNGVLYTASTNCGGVSAISTINPATGAVTPLFTVSGPDSTCLIDIAINAQNELYGVDIISDRLIKINLNTGVGTPIGYLGVDANFAQGLSFDQVSGRLYWAYDGVLNGQLRVIDTASGGSALIGAFPSGHEVDCLAFTNSGGSNIPWLSEAPTSGAISGGYGQNVTVSYTPPTLISQLGTYTGQLRIGNNTPYGTGIVPVTMTVQIPSGWGYVEGIVSGLGECDGGPAVPLQGAYVEIRRNSDNSYWGSTYTDASGHYRYPALAGSYKVSAVRLNYVFNQVVGVPIPSGRATYAQNITLRRKLPCMTVTPLSLSASLFVGNTTTGTLNLSNTGAGVGTAFLLERPGSKDGEALAEPQANLLLDPSFELFTTGSPWQQYSLVFGTPLCTPYNCNTLYSAHTGDVYAWFGGSGSLEEGYVKQTVTIPSGTASLIFWLATPTCNNGAADYMVVQIDGVEVFRVNSTAPTCGDVNYYPQSVNLTPYANGAAHEIKFFSHVIGGANSNFFVDDVSVEAPGWSDVSWLSEAPNYVTLAAGGNASDTVTFNAAGMAPGSYIATIIGEMIPKQPTNIAVNMVVGGPPSGLTATAASQTQINLHWNDNSSNEDGFKIERSPDGSTGWTQIATVGAGVVDYANTSLTCATPYWYRVRAYRSSFNSTYSNIATTSTLPCTPAAPSGLTATPFSQTQINLHWNDNSSNEDGFKIERSPNGSSGWVQIATVGAGVVDYPNTGLTCGTPYWYRVRAYNAGGDSAYSNIANATTLPCTPAAPSGLTATPFSQTQINLHWTDNSSNEDGFKIERSPNGSSGWVQIATVGAGVVDYPNTGLTCGTPYWYRVRAYNAGGDSAYSNIANATTLPCTPAAPTGLTATPFSQTQINLHWTDNSSNEDGFKIERSPNGTTGWVQIATVGSNVQDYPNTGLTCGTPYWYRVRAYNAGGDSSYSNIANATTQACTPPPAAPSGLTATPFSQTQINLHWTDNSGNEDGFKIERSPNGSSGWVQIGTVGSNVQDYPDSGLTCGTPYWYRVRAYNGGGDSAYSNVANATTSPCTPAAPTGLTATPVSQTQINLHWNDNSNNEDGFKIERSPNGTTGWVQIATVGSNVQDYPNTGLTCGTPYWYRVRAYNVGGDSAYSNIANASTLPCTPAAPTGLTATPASQTQINLHWNDNSNNEDGFKIERSPDGTTGWTQIGTVGPNVQDYPDTGLTCGTPYWYRVRAYNAGGDSPYSNVANATTVPCVPAAPSGLTATPFSQMQINLHWNDNSNNEDGFKIERSPDGATGWAEIGAVGSNVQDYLDSGLTCGTDYYYRVRAYNAGGNSGYSNTAHGVTAPCIPAAPTDLVVTGIGQTWVSLQWTDNSSNEDGFKIERSPDGVGGWVEVGSVGTDVNTYTDPGLSAGTDYYYRVRSYNGAGYSAYTDVVHVQTKFFGFWLPYISKM
jgi:hypothetical protein